MWAWRPGLPDPKTHRRRLIDSYDDCQSCFTGEADREQQRKRRCPVINEREWAAPDLAPSTYMGGGGPHGESNCDGCPGAWYRCAFTMSFEKYRRGERGALATSSDRLVTDAIQYYESELARYEDSVQ